MKRVTPLVVLLLFVSFTSVAQFLTSAKLYMRYKEYDKAEASALKAAEKDPNDEEAWFILGQARHELKKYPEMIDAFDKALAIDKVHATEISNLRRSIWASSFNDGIRYYNGGKDTADYYDKAIASFKTAILAQPESSATYYVKGRAHHAKQEDAAAANDFKLALEKNPKNLEAADLLARLHFKSGYAKREKRDEAGAIAEFKLAAECLEKAREIAPNDIEVVKLLTEAYKESKQGDRALAMTTECLKANPNDRSCRFTYGAYLLNNSKFEECILEFKKVMEVEPDTKDDLHASAVYNTGAAYLNWGVALKKASDEKIEESLKAQKGKKGKPQNIKEDLSYKEKYRSAIPYLEKFTEFKPDDANLFSQLGLIYANLNMTKEAKAAYDKADKLMKGK